MLAALIFALAAGMPGGARAKPMQLMPMQLMPMQMAPMDTGAGQPCEQCPDHPVPGPMSGKMALCPMLVCVGPLVTLPTMNPVGSRIAQKIAYPAPAPARFAGAAPVPDPFPPKP